MDEILKCDHSNESWAVLSYRCIHLTVNTFCLILLSHSIQQLENECKRQQEIEIEQQQDNEHAQSQAEDEIESDSEADEEYFVPRLEPTNKICAESFVCSKSLSSIGERLAAIEFNKPELSAPHVVMETPPTVERQEGLFAVREEFPDLTTIATTDSFNRLKELADRICPESTLG